LKPRKSRRTEGARFLTEIKDSDHVFQGVESRRLERHRLGIRYLAKNFVEVSEAARKDVMDFLNALDDHDDVHRVYAAVR